MGAEGASDTFMASLREAFNNRELLKVKVLENAPMDARAAADHLARELRDVQVPQVIGRTIVLYRPDPDHPAIRLPD
jgi:RNA-binding protein